MAFKTRNSIVLALIIIVLYFMFIRETPQESFHTMDVLQNVGKEHEQDFGKPPKAVVNPGPYDTAPAPAAPGVKEEGGEKEEERVESTTSVEVQLESSTSVAIHATATWVADGKDGSGDNGALNVVASSASAAPEATNVADGKVSMIVESSSTGAAVPETTGAVDDGATLQAQFEKEYDALGQYVVSAS
jgi:hypothetical protein